MSTMSSFARSFSRLSTSLLECPDVDEEEDRLPEGIPSVGSMLHETQQCRPCAWFWKPMGCANGSDCRHCHLCPAGELTRQRKVHRFMARQRRRSPSRSVRRSASLNGGIYEDP
eukprot:g22679.t1